MSEIKARASAALHVWGGFLEKMLPGASAWRRTQGDTDGAGSRGGCPCLGRTGMNWVRLHKKGGEPHASRRRL